MLKDLGGLLSVHCHSGSGGAGCRDVRGAARAWTMLMVIVPLIMAASAPASTLGLPAANYTCSYTMDNGDGGGPCSGGATVLTGSGAMNGVGLWLAAGGLDLGDLTGSITMSTHGPGPALSSGTVLPLSWGFDFSIADDDGAGLDPAWQLTFTLADVTGQTILASASFSGNNSGPVFGSGSLTTLASSNAGDNIALRAELVEQGDPDGGYDVQVQIPESGTFDLGPVQPSSVPEPSTMALFGVGLAWLGWRHARRGRHP